MHNIIFKVLHFDYHIVSSLFKLTHEWLSWGCQWRKDLTLGTINTSRWLSGIHTMSLLRLNGLDTAIYNHLESHPLAHVATSWDSEFDSEFRVSSDSRNSRNTSQASSIWGRGESSFVSGWTWMIRLVRYPDQCFYASVLLDMSYIFPSETWGENSNFQTLILQLDR
jgi:hypothetical protein